MSFKIDVNEEFPYLANAPIVEAVIEVRARAAGEWQEERLKPDLTSTLPDYPEIKPQRIVQVAAHFDDHGPRSHSRRDSWQGLRMTSADKLQIAQFNRDGFVFSRLAPYQDWERFSGEALRLWGIHAKLAKPTEVERLGVRFINWLALSGDLQDLLNDPPRPPAGLDLPLSEFLHQESLAVPGYPYAVTLRRMSAAKEMPPAPAIVLDIDVYTTQPCLPATVTLNHKLAEMRWLKDKAFFGTLTKEAIRGYLGGS